METYYTHEQIKNQIDAIHARSNKQPIITMQSSNTQNRTEMIKAQSRIAALEKENQCLKVALVSAKVSATAKQVPAKASAIAPKTEPPTHDHLAVKAHYKTLTGEARFAYFQKHKNTITA